MGVKRFSRRAHAFLPKARNLIKSGNSSRAAYTFLTGAVNRFLTTYAYGVHCANNAQVWDVFTINDPLIITPLATAAGLGASSRICTRKWYNMVNYRAQVNSGVKYDYVLCKPRYPVPSAEGSPYGLLNLGITEQDQIGTHASAVTWGTTVFDSPRFCHYYQVVKRKRGFLKGGQDLKIKISSSSTPRSWLIGPQASQIAEKGSTTCFIRFFGGPDNDGSGVAGTEPVFGAGRVVVDATWEIGFQWAEVSQGAIQYINNFAGGFGTAQNMPELFTGTVAVVENHNWDTFVP